MAFLTATTTAGLTIAELAATSSAFALRIVLTGELKDFYNIRIND